MNNEVYEYINNHIRPIDRHLDELNYMHQEFMKLHEYLGEREPFDKKIISRDESKRLAGEIINSIGFQRYIDLYNYMLSNDKFKYVENYDGASLRYENKKDEKTYYIQLPDKESDINQVVTIVHELIHGTNMPIENSAQYLLNEFISMYFEKYAEQYLLNNICTESDLDTDWRLYETYNKLSIIFDNKTEWFDNNQEIGLLASRYSSYYKHLLGFYLSEWASIHNIPLDFMITFNENLLNFENENEALNALGINDLKEVTDEVNAYIKDRKSVKTL